MIDISTKCNKVLPEELSSKIVYRLRDDIFRYPVTSCAKRDVNEMKKEGLSNCINPVQVEDKVIMLNANKYFRLKDSKKFKLVKKDNILEKIKKKVKKLQKQN